MEILEREVERIVPDGEPERKTIGEIIDPERDMYTDKNGNVIIDHRGILKLADFVGAEWDYELEDKPSHYNDRGFYYKVFCRFPDGSVSISSGEASDLNTEKGNLSNRFKQNQAIIRGKNKSFLRSRYMGLHSVYSQEEADEFEKNKIITLNEQIQKLQAENKNKTNLIFKLAEYASLPETDEKYPDVKIKDVWAKHGDKEYLLQLCSSENEIIAWLAKGMIKTIERSEQQKQEENQEAKPETKQEEKEEIKK